VGQKKNSDSSIDKIKKRASTMLKERPSHKDVLEFFRDVVLEQHKIKTKVKTSPVEIEKENATVKLIEGFPLIEKRALTLDIPSATRLFKRLCKIMSRNKKASHDAEQISQALQGKEINLLELFEHASNGDVEYITDLSKKLRVKEDVLVFLTRNSLKPIFEAYANELKNYIDQERWWKGYCPICGSEPFMAELKEDGARFLVCSSCNFEWRFNRLKCPFCENEDHEKLRYFYTEKEGRSYRVDVCEKCKRYIKTVDTKELGDEAIPLLEDAGTLHLDILAQEEGYTREGKASDLKINA
jgi:FdhE protein